MSKIKKSILAAVMSFTAAVMFCAVPSVSGLSTCAAGASEVNKLSVNHIYKTYDFTGDGVADTFAVQARSMGSYYSYISVYINGAEVFVPGKNAVYFGSDDIQRIVLDGTPLLFLSIDGENGDNYAYVLKYEDGAMNSIAEPCKNMSKVGNHCSAYPLSVSGSSITFKYGMMTYSLAGIYSKYKYTYSGGKMKQTTHTSSLTPYNSKMKGKYWTAMRTMYVVKAPNSSKRIAKINKGGKVRIDRFYISSKHTTTYFHVQFKNGKSGWVKGLKQYPTVKLFKEVFYAG